MNALIEKRIAELNAKKQETQDAYTDKSDATMLAVLAERNMQIGLEISFLTKLDKNLENKTSICKKENCYNDAVCGEYCGTHCNCLA